MRSQCLLRILAHPFVVNLGLCCYLASNHDHVVLGRRFASDLVIGVSAQELDQRKRREAEAGLDDLLTTHQPLSP